MANFFGNAFFGGGFFGARGTVAPSGPLLGGKGDNKKVPFKPTGLLHLPKKARKGIEDRVEESREIQAEVAGELARQLREEIEVLERPPVERMSFAEIDREIGYLLRKRIRTEEEEILLLLLMAAAG